MSPAERGVKLRACKQLLGEVDAVRRAVSGVLQDLGHQGPRTSVKTSGGERGTMFRHVCLASVDET